jgi:hypothetical protein
LHIFHYPEKEEIIVLTRLNLKEEGAGKQLAIMVAI